ncbi:hypothetical protein ACN2MM_09845 [Alkalilimnicola ehrlichii MLHE-1]|uniref:Putative signal peptide protein n=1 Tax=Alkalilimnicola ehrlichii (strain ATCC BAA-1101 / DSM 17681 / MLHE-1) TaxID=187272 RepID=Q0A7M3_ALKEH|nr:hypothetical protein [Alkalilimnicola ehrlichii]ABI57164.1 putative signal peptide protein [Alkalilimnicola ehrlichii MLHE-1]
MAGEGTLHLLLPGLLGPVPRAAARAPEVLGRFPGLADLLNRSTAERSPSGELTTLLAARLEDPDALCAGPLGLVAEGVDPAEGYWFRADPVMLHPDRDRIVVFHGGPALPEPSETDELVMAFNGFFSGDGVELRAPAPQRWYLRVPEALATVTTTPLHAVIGRGMGEALPRGEQAGRWASLLNEAQMLFHTHPVNQVRQDQGRPMINGIWPWGGGRLRPLRWRNELAGLHGDDLTLIGLGKHTGVQVAPLDLDRLPETDDGDHLVVCDGPARALAEQDLGAWLAWLEALERGWFRGLAASRRRVRLDAGTGRAWTRTGGGRWRFWRRRHDLDRWLSLEG